MIHCRDAQQMLSPAGDLHSKITGVFKTAVKSLITYGHCVPAVQRPGHLRNPGRDPIARFLPGIDDIHADRFLIRQPSGQIRSFCNCLKTDLRGIVLHDDAARAA